MRIPGTIRQAPRVDPNPGIGRTIDRARPTDGDGTRTAGAADRQEGREAPEDLVEAATAEEADTR